MLENYESMDSHGWYEYMYDINLPKVSKFQVYK